MNQVKPVSIIEIEDALLALPRNSELERHSLELRMQACYVAALYGAEFWKLKKFTGYAEPVISQAVKKMDDNDVIVDGRIAESFVRARTKADALIDRIRGIGQTPEVKTETVKPVAEKKPVEIIKGKVALVVTEAIFEAANNNRNGFTFEQVAEVLRARGYLEVGQYRIAFRDAAKQLAKKGRLVVLQRGVRGGKPTPNVYGLPGQVVVPTVNSCGGVEGPVLQLTVSDFANLESACCTPDEAENSVPAPPLFDLKELQNLHDKKLADAQAIARVLQMLGWGVA